MESALEFISIAHHDLGHPDRTNQAGKFPFPLSTFHFLLSQFQHLSFPLFPSPFARYLFFTVKMDKLSTTQTLSLETLELARTAFARFHTQCFWFMREDLEISEEHLEMIIRGLRTHGNREAFLLAARLCH
jgi:hypothetical protein